jgi:Flp pilus assembly protein TadG
MARQAQSGGSGRFGRGARLLLLRTLHIGRDSRGVSMLEFGLFIPIMAVILLGAVDLARGLAMKFGIEQATHRTMELATLRAQPLADYSFLRDEAAAAADVPVAQVTLDQWLECNNTRHSSFTGTCAPGQQAARYITISVWKDYTPMFAGIPFVRLADANGKIRLAADSGVRIQ